ncbi:MAG: hypothetical protein GY749_24225 [Desulfobacteraceae bacterium]|nr:hypothetical protein [Desulfobacteraceae bacterium]
MNLDFHYYGTYTAAKLAGYSSAEAATIAYAAQYVDVSDRDHLEHEGRALVTGTTMVPTVESVYTLATKNIVQWSSANVNESVNIWLPFHFLPGNFGAGQRVQYNGETTSLGIWARWRYTHEYENYFGLMCLNDSDLLARVVNQVVESDSQTLELIGLTMHVLADTWSHTYYAGIPAWYINDAGSQVTNILPDNSRNAGQITQDMWQVSPRNAWITTPVMPYYNSYAYLGHGRMGHLPDLPYLHYEYYPNWAGGEAQTRDNTPLFCNAFWQMVYAMTCIRSKQPFKTREYSANPAHDSLITSILSARVDDQSTMWVDKINAGMNFDPPALFDASKWKDEYMRNPTPESSYHRFNTAARSHLDFVLNDLKTNDARIPYQSGDAYSRRVVLKSSTGAYLGEPDSSGYAFMSNIGAPHLLSHGRSGALQHNDSVTIKTENARVGNKNFLGAWRAAKGLYYYTEKYDIGRQSWVIKKLTPPNPDNAEENVIASRDRVVIANENYTNKPHMIPYDDGKYDNVTITPAESIWYIEEVEQPTGLGITPPIHRVTLQAPNGRFIGACRYKLEWGASQYYPHLDGPPVPLTLSASGEHTGNTPLKTDEVVQIKTDETVTAEYQYLGAWKDSSLYYYKKDYDKNKQGWKLEKADTHDPDGTIRDGDQIRLINQHYSKVPYMCLNYKRYVGLSNRKDPSTVWVIRIVKESA